MFLIVLGIIALLIGVFGSRADRSAAKFKSLINLIGAILIAVGFATSALVQVDAGYVGIQTLFGKVQDRILREGLNVINPLVKVTDMSVQTQNYTMSGAYSEGQKLGDDAIRVLSKDGLEVVIDLTVLYRVIPSEAPKIYREIGLNYEEKIIRPVVRSKIRESAVNYDAVDLFSTYRRKFETQITASIEDEFLKRGIKLENLLIRNINLPKSVKQSIERKITAIQDAQRMKYVLEKEKQEAERKRVEAQGVADAQKIINSGLSEKILQFETIKVQKELVKSPNAKIIILGSGKGSPPFIIGN